MKSTTALLSHKSKTIVFLAFLLSSQFTEGQLLTSAEIGSQTWTNTNYAGIVFQNGDTIPQAKTKEDWLRSYYREEPTWCYYGFDASNSSQGILYNYYCITDNRKLAPSGWRIPTFFDYYELAHYLDPLVTKVRFLDPGWHAAGPLYGEDIFHSFDHNNREMSSGFNAFLYGNLHFEKSETTIRWTNPGERINFWQTTGWTDTGLRDFFNADDYEKYLLTIAEFQEFIEEHVWTVSLVSSFSLQFGEDPKGSGYYLRLIKNSSDSEL